MTALESAVHADALAVLRRWLPPNPRLSSLRQAFVAHLEAHPDGASRACVPLHLTASAFVVDSTASRVLLTLHAKAQRWFQVGGHIDDDDPTVLAAAAREASEESGIEGLVFDPTPIHLSNHAAAFCRGAGDHTGGDVRHLDVRFLAVAPPGAEPVISEESLDLRWWPIARLPNAERDFAEAVDFARQRAHASF